MRTLDLLCAKCTLRLREPVIVRCCSSSMCRACAEEIVANRSKCAAASCDHYPSGALEHWIVRSQTLEEIVHAADDEVEVLPARPAAEAPLAFPASSAPLAYPAAATSGSGRQFVSIPDDQTYVLRGAQCV